MRANPQPCTVQILTAQCADALMASDDPKIVSAVRSRPDVHASVVQSVIKNFSDLPPMPMGGKPAKWRRENNRRINAVTAAVKAEMSQMWKVYLGIGAAIFVLVTGGLGMLLIIVIGAVLSWAIQDYLDNHNRITQARASMGLA